MRLNGVEAEDAGGEKKPPAFQVIVLVCTLSCPVLSVCELYGTRERHSYNMFACNFIMLCNDTPT